MGLSGGTSGWDHPGGRFQRKASVCATCACALAIPPPTTIPIQTLRRRRPSAPVRILGCEAPRPQGSWAGPMRETMASVLDAAWSLRGDRCGGLKRSAEGFHMLANLVINRSTYCHQALRLRLSFYIRVPTAAPTGVHHSNTLGS